VGGEHQVDASVHALALTVDALGVDLQQYVDAVSGTLGYCARCSARKASPFNA
jgi:hypothetical protein